MAETDKRERAAVGGAEGASGGADAAGEAGGADAVGADAASEEAASEEAAELRAEEESAKAMAAEVPHPEGFEDTGQEPPAESGQAQTS